MAHFGLNWEESKWLGHLSSTFLNFFASKIGVKLPPGKKVPWHRCWAALGRGSNCHFFQKNAFFGQKKAFFQKVHFIQKWSVTPNTIFEWVKNDFLFSNPKLVFFTEFNLFIWIKLAAKHFEIILNLLLLCGAPSPPWVCWGLKLKWEAIWLNIWLGTDYFLKRV